MVCAPGEADVTYRFSRTQTLSFNPSSGYVTTHHPRSWGSPNSVCFFAGFLAGAYTAPGRRASTPRSKASLLQRMADAVGWFFYRLLVGYLVGILATFAYAFLIIAPCFALAHVSLDLDKIRSENPEVISLAGGGFAAIFSSWSGGVCGALLVTRRSPSDRPPLSSRAIRSSFLGFLIGVLFGASMGWLPAETQYFVVLAASVPIGILAGIVGGIWTELRQRRIPFPPELESRL